MVFESLVADLLNKYLGEYVDNLDRSQLKIGIWGGDVVLKDLSLKQSALDDLQLPVKTVSGFLGKLVLKIPWKNLYSEPVEATIEDLYLLVAPNTEVIYDPVKEEKWKQEAKQAAITKVEEAKRSERDKDKPKPNDTFTEKLATQIVRNVQISIQNIHIRYEDRVHNIGRPFALGVTLSKLLVTTTDENWVPRISSDVTSMIYKILEVEGLSVYWNTKNRESFLQVPPDLLGIVFKEGIATKDMTVEKYHYLLGPINSTSKLTLNTKPENDGSNFTHPKVLLRLQLEKLQIKISKNQYQDLMVLLDSMERMSRAAPYRKYRPVVPSFKGYYKEWWRFAYQCILEEEVRRRRNNWDWLHILAHRHLCREYANAYRKKLSSTKPAKDVVDACERCESVLDVLNIVLVRQKIEVEVNRRESKEQMAKLQKTGWFSGWWSGSKDEEESTKTTLIKQFEEAMTPAEKAKLYQAIGYQANSAPTQYPIDFVAVDLNFTLNSLELEVKDEIRQVLSGCINEVKARFEQRPAGQAFKFGVTLRQFLITGVEQGNVKPLLVETKTDLSMLSSTDLTASDPLLDIVVEVKPLDGLCDQRVHVTSRPLHIVYDALTINNVTDVFTVEQSAFISHIQTAATDKLTEIKAKSALGLQYALEQQSILDLKVHLMGFYGILAQGGHYTGDNQPLVVVNFGQIIINSKPRENAEINVKQLYKQGITEKEIMAMMLERSYDYFVVELRSLQLQMILPGEKWKIHHTEASEQCILEPTHLEVNLAKSLLDDQPENPKIKVNATLPAINLNISEGRLLAMIGLLVSIPLPDSKEQDEPQIKYQRYGSHQSLNKVLEIARATKTAEIKKRPAKKKEKKKTARPAEEGDDLDFVEFADFSKFGVDEKEREQFTQFTEVLVQFKLNEVSLGIFQKSTDNKEIPLADFHVLALEASLEQNTYDLKVDIKLGGLSLNQNFKGSKIHVINTPMAEGKEEYLFIVKYFKAVQSSPVFESYYNNVVQQLDFNFTQLDVLVHQEAILAIVEWANDLQDTLTNITKTQPLKPPKKTSRSATPTPSKAFPNVTSRIMPIIHENDSGMTKTSSRAISKKDDEEEEVSELLLKAVLGEITVTLRNNIRLVGAMDINGGSALVILKPSSTTIYANLKNFEFIDLCENTIHRKVLSIVGSEDAFQMSLVMYNVDVLKQPQHLNMSVQVQIARFQVVFLNYFVHTLLEFSNQFSNTQAAIKEASVAAAGVAKVNMQQAYKEAYRISLNIKLKAPIILIPANSSSLDALLMDFGVLTLKNEITELELPGSLSSKNSDQPNPVIDTLNIGLQNFKVSRVRLKSAHEVASESLIVQPASFSVSVIRNLCAGCSNEIPDLDIRGGLESIHVVLSQEDYIQVMAVIMQNLGEVPPTPVNPEVVPVQPVPQPNLEISNPAGEEAKPKTVSPTGGLSAETAVEKDTVEPVWTVVMFSFTLNQMVIELFEGASVTKNGGEVIDGAVCPLRQHNGLARFTLLQLSVKGSLLSDSALSSSIVLRDCWLDDTRDTRHDIYRYMECKSSDPDGRQRMIDITFQQKGKSMFVNIGVTSFILILNIEHLLKVADLFVSSQQQLSESTTPSTSHHKAPLPKESVMPDQRAVVVDEPDPDRNITITLKVLQPDIILVERMDLNTNAIILNNEIEAKVRLTGPLVSIVASMKDLQLFSCRFDPSKRKETKAEILRPVTISLLGSTPSGQGLHVELSTTHIRLSVTPGTIELLNSVLMSLTANKQDELEEEQPDEDYSNLWSVKPFDPEEFWFLKTAEGEDISQLIVTKDEKQDRDQICLVRVPSLVITLEAGVGSKTLPMLLLETSLQAQARNWDSFVNVDGTLTFQVSYYNSHLALWEPLVEPVEITRPGGGTIYAPWELKIQIETNDPNRVDDSDLSDCIGLEDISINKPRTVVTVVSKDTMEVTVTKTSLDVLKTLAAAFNKAIFEPESKVTSISAPYVVQNDLGLDVTLSLTEGVFVIYDPAGKQISIKDVVLETGAKVNLSLAQEESEVRSMVGQIYAVKEKFLQFQFQVSDRFCELETPVTRADKRYFSLEHRGANNDNWGIVSDVQVLNGSTIITLRGIIQIQNHFHTPVRVYFMTKRGNELELVGVVEPHKNLNLPLHAIYTPTNELFFSVEGYSVSNAPFIWKDLQQSLAITKILQCNSKDIENKDPFFIKAVGEMEQVYHEFSNRHTMASTCYNIHLRPTVILKNFLPVDVVVCTQGVVGDKELKAGTRMQIPTAEPGSSTIVIRICQYLNKDWSCKREILANPPELSVWTFHYLEGAEHSRSVLDLGMHCVNDNGSLKLSLYCPFWMINKTGLMLSYRKSSKAESDEEDSSAELMNDSNVHYHPPHYKGPIMFSFRAKSFYGKKKSSIKVNKGEWSNKFSLDVAGSSGTVNCKADNTEYQIGVHIQLTYNTLTKQVTFTPYYVLVNHCSVDMHVLEVNGSSKKWIKVEPNAVSPFWPESKGSPAELMVRLAESTETTVPFPYNRTLNCLLKLKNKYGAVSVDVQKTEGAAYITIAPYGPGLATALIVNHSAFTIPLQEKVTQKSLTLKGGEEVLFNWSTTKENSVLTWGDKSASDLRKDEVGEFTVEPNAKLYWVTFLDGMQRVLLFTSDPDIAREAEVAHMFEVSNLEVQANIHGIGLSVVDNISKQEIFYLGITSSGVVWESRKVGTKKFKHIAPRDSAKIEEAYTRYKQELAVGNSPICKCAVGDNIVVDFATNQMLRPNTRELRRTYKQGLWAKYRSSLHQWQLHVKVNRLQMDNQSFDCVFPIVFAPVPPPKSVSAETVTKPFAELSLVQRLNRHSVVQQIKYFKVLVQEFHIKVDIGFLNSLIKMFEASTTSDEEEEALFAKDLSAVDESLIAHVTLLSSQDQKNFYDHLHFSPLKIHVSFSLSGGGVQSTQSLPPVLNVLMQSLGVTLTDLQDVVFKLSYFERTYTFLNQKQLMSEVQLHYRGQLLKQLYVLVLGLDVLGNPFGLVVGLKEGVQDLFYEPFQGAIQGPGEFCEGIVLGVRSLFGHTVGGAAGAVSRITGAMGKGLAALTFDEDYQRKRRELMNTRPNSMPQGLAQSGKGLVMGVVEGVGGVFSKPISGAREEGVEGFIKGMGKGMVGLVTRPTAGVIDFASGSLSAVKRATELGEEVIRLRDPRCFKTDNLVRPYCKLESEGNRILKELEKGKYYTTDDYNYHTTIGNAKCHDILLLTDKRLLLLSRNDIFGGYQVEFTHIWGELITPPVVVAKGIEIKTGIGKKKLFRSNEHTRTIIMEDEDLKNYVAEKIKTLMLPRTSSGTMSRQSTLS